MTDTAEYKVLQTLRIHMVDWVSLADALAHIEIAMGWNRQTALAQLRAAIVDLPLPVKWADDQSGADRPPQDRSFWEQASIRLTDGGEVLHESLDVRLVEMKDGSTEMVQVPSLARYRGVLIERNAVRVTWPMPANVEQVVENEPRVTLLPASKHRRHVFLQ